MTKVNTKRLVESAILIAVSTVLILISKFFPISLPMGGSVTLMGMVPIILISYRYGVKWGLFSAFVFSLIQMLTGFNTVSSFFLPGESQMVIWKALLVCLFDYILAFTSVGLGGIFRNKYKNPAVALTFGTIVALIVRFIMHFISGFLFFGAWAEWFFSQEKLGEFGKFVLEHMSGTSLALFYSIVYNALYIVPEIIISIIGLVVISKIPSIVQKQKV